MHVFAWFDLGFILPLLFKALGSQDGNREVFTIEAKTEIQRGRGLPEIRQPWARTQTLWHR